LSVVRREEKVVEPVIESWRTVRRGPSRRGPASATLRARMLGFETAIVRFVCGVGVGLKDDVNETQLGTEKYKRKKEDKLLVVDYKTIRLQRAQ
jgi:hypothetical protein